MGHYFKLHVAICKLRRLLILLKKKFFSRKNLAGFKSSGNFT